MKVLTIETAGRKIQSHASFAKAPLAAGLPRKVRAVSMSSVDWFARL